MFTKRMVPGIVFQRLKISLLISIFNRHILNKFVVTVILETNILVILNVLMKYSASISSQNVMFNDILIFGEMAGFKIVPFIATHVKMFFFFFNGTIKKKKKKKKKNSDNQNPPICMKTTEYIYISRSSLELWTKEDW